MSHLQTLVVGVGSPHGDDQAGWLVAEQLAGLHDRNGIAVRKATSAAELLDWLGEVDGPTVERLIICDACRGLGRVGQVRRWTWPADALVEASWSGTHDLPLPAVLKLGERLGSLPRQVTIWSIEGSAHRALATMSPEVVAGLPGLVEAIANEAIPDKTCTNDRS